MTRVSARRPGRHAARGSRRRSAACPRRLQVYLVGLVVAGLACAAAASASAPARRDLPLFAGPLLVLAAAHGGGQGLRCPLTQGGSTLSLSYVVNFVALCSLGPWPTVPIAVRQRVEPVHVQDARAEPVVPDAVQHGRPRRDGRRRGLVYHGWRSATSAGHRSWLRSARRRWRRRSTSCSTACWWPRPSPSRSGQHAAADLDAATSSGAARRYYIGAADRGARRVMVTEQGGRWWALILAVPGVPHLPQLPGLHRAHRRGAAAGAGDVRRAAGDDRGAGAGHRGQGLHVARPPAPDADVRRGPRARARHERTGGARREDRGAAARHRQPGGARTHPLEDRPAHPRRVRAAEDPPARRRRHHQVGAVPVPGGVAGAGAPRALGRARLPGRPRRARTSRSAPGSWRSSTASPRCWRNGRTGRRAPTPRPSPRCARTAGRRSTRRWSSSSSRCCRLESQLHGDATTRRTPPPTAARPVHRHEPDSALDRHRRRAPRRAGAARHRPRRSARRSGSRTSWRSSRRGWSTSCRSTRRALFLFDEESELFLCQHVSGEHADAIRAI